MVAANRGPEFDLAVRIKNLEAQVKALSTTPLLQSASINAANGNPVITLGLVPGSNPPEYGIQFLNPITGAQIMFIGEDSMGNISLIGNTALTAPVSPAAVHAGATAFTLSGTVATLATATVVVPAGYSRALVFAIANVSGINSTSSLDSIFAGVSINGVPAAGSANGEDANSTATYKALASSVAAGSSLVTGLSGGTFPVSATGLTAGLSWASSAFNVANIDATVLFLR